MQSPVTNPWSQLPSAAPFALPQDAELIRAFNATARQKFKVQLDALPEPYLGSPTAPVVLLSLNPGFIASVPHLHANIEFSSRLRANLVHDASWGHLNHLLDPAIDRTDYWEKKLKCLIDRFDLKFIANNLLCVELFPYASERFGHAKLDLPSQRYSFHLVKEAIDRRAVILLLRGRRVWSAKVPELACYPLLYAAQSPQNPTISYRNFPEGLDKAFDALEEARSGRENQP